MLVLSTSRLHPNMLTMSIAFGTCVTLRPHGHVVGLAWRYKLENLSWQLRDPDTKGPIMTADRDGLLDYGAAQGVRLRACAMDGVASHNVRVVQHQIGAGWGEVTFDASHKDICRST